MSTVKERVTALFKRLEASQVILVEWETPLQIRLGYPLVSDGSLFFLVPDSQLRKVHDLAAEVGLSPADESFLRSVYPCERSGLAIRYLFDESPRIFLGTGPARRRLVFLPISWTGITRDEIVPIPAEDSLRPHSCMSVLPAGSTWTVPLPAACASLMRIIAGEKRGSRLRVDVVAGLASVVTYNLFDMSYDGDYMEYPPNDQPLSDQEILEIENAVAELKRWSFREDEEWMRKFLIEVMMGENDYDKIPYQENDPSVTHGTLGF